MSVIALEDDDRIVAQSHGFQTGEHLSDVIIGAGDRGGVRPTRHRHRGVSLAVLFQMLLGIMRNIKSQIEKKVVILIAIEEFQRPLRDQFRKILSWEEDFLGFLVEIVKTFAVQVKVFVVVDKAIANSEEFVKALTGRATLRFFSSEQKN